MKPWLTACCLAGVWAFASRLPADDRAAVARLLDSSAERTTADVAATRKCYEQLRRSKGADSRLDYAYGLALVNQRRYQDAVPFLEGYARAHRDDLAAARVWLYALVQGRRYPEALAAAVDVAEPLGGRSGADTRATARFLGGLFGYFDVACAGAIPAPLKLERTNELLARLSQQNLVEFDAGRSLVVDQYEALEQQRSAADALKAADAGRRESEAQAALESGRAQAASAQDAVEAHSEALRDGNRQLALVRRQLLSLTRQRVWLTGQIAETQRLLGELYQPQTRTQTREVVVGPNPTEESTVVTRQGVVNLDRNAQAQALTLTLGTLNRQAFDVDRRLVELRARAAELGYQQADDAQSLAAGRESAETAQKRTAAREKQLLRLKRNKPEPRGPSAAMLQLSTYLPFPFEQERQRVLDWFDGGPPR